MTRPVLDRGLPWTEEDYLALGKSGARVELFHGVLVVSPCATPLHQGVTHRLARLLEPAARAAGQQVHWAVNVRLRPGRVAIPDVAVTAPIDPDTLVVDVSATTLVGEVIATNAAVDRVLKMHYFAVAGIPWYLLVDPRGPTLSLHRLDGDRYLEEATATPGQVLRFTHPIVTELDPATLA